MVPCLVSADWSSESTMTSSASTTAAIHTPPPTSKYPVELSERAPTFSGPETERTSWLVGSVFVASGKGCKQFWALKID